MQVMATAVAGHQQVGAQPSRWCGEGAEGGVEEAGLLEPGDDVAAAGPPRQPRRPPAGQEHLAARFAQLLGELAAGLAAAHDQDLARRQGCGVAVVVGIEHQHLAREPGRDSRAMGPLVGAGAHHNRRRPQLAGRGAKQEPAAGSGFEAVHPDALANRRREARRVPLEVSDDLVAGDEALGVVAGVGGAGQAHGPVRRDQPEAVPQTPPALANPCPLQHQVLEPAGGQLIAHRQPGLARSNHHHREPVGHCDHPAHSAVG